MAFSQSSYELVVVNSSTLGYRQYEIRKKALIYDKLSIYDITIDAPPPRFAASILGGKRGGHGGVSASLSSARHRSPRVLLLPPPPPPPLLALSKSSPRPITDDEIREKKNACYADIESGLWGWKCRASVIAKENCALLCLSPRCYELIYEDDPLEEGEKDFVRGQEYKYCMHKLSMGDSLDGVKGAFNF
uniref:Uncharacterized protein n=1 Tax=Ananas comosus var. bracteatus TaxID=296719 RepID=A0A6V7PP35_ANACO|nr:unnamed protein product [Ananas comosus var. bracteatus]